MIKGMIVVAAAMAAASAQAVTYSSTPGNTVPAGQSVIVDFDTPTPGVTYSGSYTVDAMSVSGIRAEPAGDTTKYFATPGSSDPTPGTATIDFTGYLATHNAFRSLSFYWGSIDKYNTLTLLGTGLSMSTFTGLAMGPPADGDQSAAATNRRVSFTFAPGEKLTGLQLSSGSRAFEIDDIAAAAVPEPAMWAMLVAGFGLVGTALRRRSRAVVA